jgi:pyruvate/2-oxoglutarate/acetoin dehydrogenase E1 component
MGKMTLVQAVRSALQLALDNDPRVLLLGEDVGRDGGVFRATEGLLDRFGPERVVDTPLAESGIVGLAIGLALNGYRPVAEIQFEGFLLPALDQLASHAARYHTRTRGQWSVPLVVRSPWGGGIHAPEHHSDSPEALFTHIPGLKVVLPSTPYDAKGLLLAAIEDPDPVLFLEPKRLYRAVRQEIPDEFYTIPLGQARLVREGQQVTLVSWGAPLRDCEEALDERPDISADLIDLRSLAPLDFDTVLDSVRKTGRAVIVHEAPRTCGLGAEIAAAIQEHCLLHLQAPVVRVTGADAIMPLHKLEKLYLPDSSRIGAAIEEVLTF